MRKKAVIGKPEKPSFQHKKSLGQNFLTSDIVPGWLCQAAKLQVEETVLEIGPGTGRLTTALLKGGAKVIAVEADPRAVESLNATFAVEISSGQLILHLGDARELTPEKLGLVNLQFKVVANIPYFLSGLLLRLMLESSVQPNTLVFLMQKELVARIVRDPKESLLALGVKAFGEPKYIKTISRGHFYPVPNVDSAILGVYNITMANFTDIDKEFFFTLLHLGLGKKRKQLIGNLSQQFAKPLLVAAFASLNLKPDIRGEDVDLTTWLSLARALSNQ